MARVSKKVKPVYTIPEDCDDDCKRRIINSVLTQIHPQLVINSYKVATENSAWLQDILPHCILAYLEKPIAYQWQVLLDGKIENWITFAMAFQLKSGNSPFYAKYRNFSNRWDRNVEIGNDEEGKFGSEVFTVFNDELSTKDRIAKLVYNELNFYEQDILQKVWIDGWSQVRYAEHYNIIYTELLNNVSSLKNKIKRIIKTKYQKYLI